MGIHLDESPGDNIPVLNSVPITSSDGIPDENVCETSSVFENITTLPTVTAVSFGL